MTKAIVQSISPHVQIPIYARDTRNGFTSSLLGWFHAENDTVGSRNFTGFHLYDEQLDGNLLSTLPSSCQSALTQVIDCPEEAQKFQIASWYGGFENDTLSGHVCSAECDVSIKSWFQQVVKNCASVNQTTFPLTVKGGSLWASWNQTCVKDPATGQYCGGKLGKTLRVFQT